MEALAFYGGMGFNTLFVDKAARRYDTSGFLLQNVRTSKLTMRKVSQQPGLKEICFLFFVLFVFCCCVYMCVCVFFFIIGFAFQLDS